MSNGEGIYVVFKECPLSLERDHRPPPPPPCCWEAFRKSCNKQSLMSLCVTIPALPLFVLGMTHPPMKARSLKGKGFHRLSVLCRSAKFISEGGGKTEQIHRITSVNRFPSRSQAQIAYLPTWVFFSSHSQWLLSNDTMWTFCSRSWVCVLF